MASPVVIGALNRPSHIENGKIACHHHHTAFITFGQQNIEHFDFFTHLYIANVGDDQCIMLDQAFSAILASAGCTGPRAPLEPAGSTLDIVIWVPERPT